MSVVDAPVAGEERPRGQLRQELRLFEALAISVGIMAPTAAMALNGVAPAGLVGRAVPLAFPFAAIAIALVSYAFVRLTRYFNHAGSAYALVGLTVGPREGFFACWALLATYTA
jgi:amino acid transporter